MLGPVSLLLLSKVGPTGPTPETGVIDRNGFDKLSLLDTLLPVYEQLFEILAKRGATCVQLDEPSFTGDRTPAELAAFERTYQRLSTSALRPRMLVTGQYGDFGEALEILAATKVEAIGLDLAGHRVRPADLAKIPGMRRKRLYAGVISGRNVWRADRYVTLNYLEELAEVCPDLVVSTGCTLLHVPYDLLVEYDLEGNVADRLAFAKQKTARGGVAGEGAHRRPVGEVAQAAVAGNGAVSRGRAGRLREPLGPHPRHRRARRTAHTGSGIHRPGPPVGEPGRRPEDPPRVAARALAA